MRLIIRVAIVAVLVSLTVSSPAIAETPTDLKVGTGSGDPGSLELDARSHGGNGATGQPHQSGPAGQPEPVVDCNAPTLADDQATFDQCSVPSPVLGGPAPNPSPAQWAIDYSRTRQMPVPHPTISATEGITGAEHALDLHIPSEQTFVEDNTPFGPLHIHAHGRFVIDWGDGATNAYTSTGGSFGHSQITHVWTKAGHFTIVVNAFWDADWTLGGTSGVVRELRTSGAIPNWPVIELQAVLR